MNYNYVKVLAKKRSEIINEILEATLSYFPEDVDSHPFLTDIAKTIETFFLLDHCEEVDDNLTTNNLVESESKRNLLSGTVQNVFMATAPKKYTHRTTPSGHVLSVPVEEEQQRSKPNASLPIQFNKLGESAAEKLGSATEKLNILIKTTFGAEEEVKDKVVSKTLTAIDTDPQVNPLTGSITSPVVPYTRKPRRALSTRVLDEDELNEIGEEANLLVDDDRPPTEMVPSYSHPLPTFGSGGSKLGDMLENNPVIFAMIFVASVIFLRFSSQLTVTLDLDIELLLLFATFCIGLHTPRPLVGGIDKTTGPPPELKASLGKRKLIKRADHTGRLLLRASMIASPDAQFSAKSVQDFDRIVKEEPEDELIEMIQSPMPRFPEGAPLGSKLNCWSIPIPENFQVRGAKYLSDKKKIPSGPFLFPVRGVDLFLTDSCPENVGR